MKEKPLENSKQEPTTSLSSTAADESIEDETIPVSSQNVPSTSTANLPLNNISSSSSCNSKSLFVSAVHQYFKKYTSRSPSFSSHGNVPNTLECHPEDNNSSKSNQPSCFNKANISPSSNPSCSPVSFHDKSNSSTSSKDPLIYDSKYSQSKNTKDLDNEASMASTSSSFINNCSLNVSSGDRSSLKRKSSTKGVSKQVNSKESEKSKNSNLSLACSTASKLPGKKRKLLLLSKDSASRSNMPNSSPVVTSCQINSLEKKSNFKKTLQNPKSKLHGINKNATKEKIKHCDGMKVRKIRPQNVIFKLKNREIGSRNFQTKKFYENIFPNSTIVHVPKPVCFLRKFTPNGNHFIAFSADQTTVEIYDYNGVFKCGNLMKNVTNNYIKGVGEEETKTKDSIFDTIFKLKYEINVCTGYEQLNRECSLFTENSKYVIVGSAAMIPDDLRPHFYEIYTNNECVTPGPRSMLDDYSIHIIDIVNGKLTDTKQFKVDKIIMSHNQGLYLYKDTLAVLSIQHQVIHIFQIIDGMFVEVRTIGRYCYEDDSYLISSVFPHSARPFKDVHINSLKHRVLVALFKRAKLLSEINGNNQELRNFYRYYVQFNDLRLWKIQLMDENHLLLKYASEDVVTNKISEPYAQQSFLVFYDMISTQILAVYENTSEDLLYLFENFCDNFRNTRLYNVPEYLCSPSNNIYAKAALQRFKNTLISARFGGHKEATKRLLSQLPISAQSYSTSPYLDLSLFSYDDKWISVLERPKACGEYPIRFFSRDSGLLKFQIHAGLPTLMTPFVRRLVAFTFHPTDPFAISVQRTNSEYVVNFHVRNTPCD